MQPIHYYEDEFFVIKEIDYSDDEDDNIYPKLIMTQARYYELYCKNHGNFLKINENMQKL